MALHLVTAPAAEPLTTEEAKAHLRIDTLNAEDGLVDDLIAAARETAEDRTKRALITQTWELKRASFPAGCLYLPKAPLQSVTHIKYFDTANVEQTLDSDIYEVSAPSGAKAEPGRIVLAYGQSWPATYQRIDAVTIRFVAGYGDEGADVPARIRQAMLLIIGDMYRNREDDRDVPLRARQILAGFDAGMFGVAA